MLEDQTESIRQLKQVLFSFKQALFSLVYLHLSLGFLDMFSSDKYVVD